MLEFVLADALDKKCDTVITCGGTHSNHCRATVVAARQLGLNCYLLHGNPKQARTLRMILFMSLVNLHS